MKRKMGIGTVLLAAAAIVAFSSFRFVDRKVKAANFSLKTADGKVFELKKLKGKVVVVNFWATWCGPCRAEIPAFMDVYSQYKDKGVEILGISLDDGWEDVKPFTLRYAITYPVLLGNEKVSRAYGNIQAIPTTFIIDKNGDVVDRHVGVMTRAVLESKLKELL